MDRSDRGTSSPGEAGRAAAIAAMDTNVAGTFIDTMHTMLANELPLIVRDQLRKELRPWALAAQRNSYGVLSLPGPELGLDTGGLDIRVLKNGLRGRAHHVKVFVGAEDFRALEPWLLAMQGAMASKPYDHRNRYIIFLERCMETACSLLELPMDDNSGAPAITSTYPLVDNISDIHDGLMRWKPGVAGCYGAERHFSLALRSQQPLYFDEWLAVLSPRLAAAVGSVPVTVALYSLDEVEAEADELLGADSLVDDWCEWLRDQRWYDEEEDGELDDYKIRLRAVAMAATRAYYWSMPCDVRDYLFCSSTKKFVLDGNVLPYHAM